MLLALASFPGASVFVGVAIMAVLMPVHFFQSRLYEKFQLEQMKYKDQRVKMMNEILGGIKVSPPFGLAPETAVSVAPLPGSVLVVRGVVPVT